MHMHVCLLLVMVDLSCFWGCLRVIGVEARVNNTSSSDGKRNKNTGRYEQSSWANYLFRPHPHAQKRNIALAFLCVHTLLLTVYLYE